jgi:hypothetical protein
MQEQLKVHSDSCNKFKLNSEIYVFDPIDLDAEIIPPDFSYSSTNSDEGQASDCKCK